MRIARELNSLPNELRADEELALLRRKSPMDQNKLILHTVKAATRYASSMTSGRIPVDELFSIASHALIRAIRNYRSRTRPVRLIVYVRSYLRSEIMKAWRFRDPLNWKRNSADSEPFVPDVDASSLPDESGGGPDFDAIDLHERWSMVEPHLKKLSETERRVLVLVFEARLPGPVIGRMLGFTRSNVREVKLRAMKKIRAGLYRAGFLRP